MNYSFQITLFPNNYSKTEIYRTQHIGKKTIIINKGIATMAFLRMARQTDKSIASWPGRRPVPIVLAPAAGMAKNRKEGRVNLLDTLNDKCIMFLQTWHQWKALVDQ